MSAIIKRSIIFLLVIAIPFSLPASAQQKGARAPGKRTASAPETTSVQPVTLVEHPAPDYLSGEANVAVKGNMNPIIRLGMSQNGVTMIEFPVSDRFFAIHLFSGSDFYACGFLDSFHKPINDDSRVDGGTADVGQVHGEQNGDRCFLALGRRRIDGRFALSGRKRVRRRGAFRHAAPSAPPCRGRRRCRRCCAPPAPAWA